VLGAAVQLSELLEETGMNQQALKDLDIAGLTADSRAVEPGFLFAALPGTEQDGRTYINEAVQRGAAAVLAPPGTDLNDGRFNIAGAPIRLITDSNPRRRFALMAARFFNAQPDTIAAITGTNGKTSVAQFTQQLWASLGYKAGYMGTLGAQAPGMNLDGSLTTPDPVRLHSILADMAKAGTTHLAMEASSHGLHQFRIDGVRLAIAGFTTLSRDHLDYHGSMAAYLAAKLRLFSDVMMAGGVAVLNADSTEFAAFDATCQMRGHKVLSYGRNGSCIQIRDIHTDVDSQLLNVIVLGKTHHVRLPLAGAFQVSNAMCALGLVLAGGADPIQAVEALEGLKGIAGRLERVGLSETGAPVYVDFAHTPDALETVLQALRPHVTGKLTVVFGCGGDRDKGKRRLMGEKASSLADLVFVTDDNPRTEGAAVIRAQILQGCPGATEISDRADAISTAIQGLSGGDVLLLAGKGHETGQIIGTTVIPFSDAEVARQVLGQGGPRS
jgi:UDP-N-acetylmuramoyl-L-alanyl-D-glutamate--2,6-diaminopimelate ligase